MIPLYTAKSCRKLDYLAEKKFGISNSELMENAGREIFKTISENEKKIKSILIFCGKGNNGADGLVVARYFQNDKKSATIIFANKKSELNSLSIEKLNLLKNSNCKIYYSPSVKKISKIKKSIIIDALLGTSFKGELTGKYLEYVSWINKQQIPIYSVDVPSGLDSTTGIVENTSVKANYTITLGANKIGLWLNDAPNFTGKVILKEIGFPKIIFRLVKPVSYLVEKTDIKKNIPIRSKTVHKYSVGKVLAICCSRGLTGAGILATNASMKSGAGAVILAHPKSEYEIVAKRTLEVMPLALDSTNEGTLSEKSFSKIKEKLKWCDSVLIGPGLSKYSETQKLIRKIIEVNPKPIVIDADAIYAIRKNKNLLKKSKSNNIILTPHKGEFISLIGKEINNRNVLSIGKNFAKKYNVTLVLKGSPTIIFSSNEKIYINPIGNEGMATAGSGDVLSGIITSFLSQRNNALDAAINGVYIHSLAGDISAKKKTVYGLVASDIIKNLPNAIKNVLNN